MAGFWSCTTTMIFFYFKYVMTKAIVMKIVSCFKSNHKRLYAENSTIYEFKVFVRSDIIANELSDLNESEKRLFKQLKSDLSDSENIIY